jgi:hypothetical protein
LGYPIGVTLLLSAISFTSIYSYSLFHTFAELISVIVAVSIFIVVWNSHNLLKNSFFMFLGIAFLFIAGLDLSHLLAYL